MIMNNLFQRKQLSVTDEIEEIQVRQKLKHISNGLENFGVEDESFSRFI